MKYMAQTYVKDTFLCAVEQENINNLTYGHMNLMNGKMNGISKWKIPKDNSSFISVFIEKMPLKVLCRNLQGFLLYTGVSTKKGYNVTAKIRLLEVHLMNIFKWNQSIFPFIAFPRHAPMWTDIVEIGSQNSRHLYDFLSAIVISELCKVFPNPVGLDQGYSKHILNTWTWYLKYTTNFLAYPL